MKQISLRSTLIATLFLPFISSSFEQLTAQRIPFSHLGTEIVKKYSGSGLTITPSSHGASMQCVFQRLNAELTSHGMQLVSTADSAKGTSFRVVAVAIGRGEVQSLPQSGRIEVDDKVARWLRPLLTEEYSSSVDGIQQDFIIERNLDGRESLRLELEVAGARAEPIAGGACLVLDDDGRKLVYNRLKAEDGWGRELPVRLQVLSATRLALVIEDAGAKYPVRIDPTFSDAQWLSLGGVPGADGPVTSTVVDSKGNLYIGGAFDTVGHAVAIGVAKWDGHQWSMLGSGMDDVVDSLAVGPDDSLYAGGSFTSAGGVPALSIAKWDGSQWSALGSGISGGVGFTYVRALAVKGESVYAGGNFTLAGGVSAQNIAQWDGNSWSPVGAGLDASVSALALWNGSLYAGGSFTYASNSLNDSLWVGYVAQWDGTKWFALGGGLDYGVSGLTVSDNTLYVGGNFSRAFDTNGVPLTVNYVARWNGNQWSALGSGMNNAIFAVAASGSNVYAGGIFDVAGGVPVTAVARWDGNTWSALGLGIGTSPGEVNALAVSGNNLYVGGKFVSAGGVSANNIAQWNGSSWSTMGSDIGPNDKVNALLVSGSNLYAGGAFTFAGNAAANCIAKWNGSSWSGVGLGMNGGVNALAYSSGILYVGGSFTMATNSDGTAVSANRIAQWNGTNWSALRLGLNNQVYALATSGSNLFVGGGFTLASNAPATAVSVNYIAQWDGVAWSALGWGMAGGGGNPARRGVYALAVSSDGRLYAGGLFTTAGAVLANNIAQWDGFFDWYPLGMGTSVADFFPAGPPPVGVLVASGGTLYAGGTFKTVTNGNGAAVTANCIASWNGSAWFALGPGMSSDGFASVRALALASNGFLYAGGTFTTAGGLAANRIAQWNGNSWSPLDSGISGNGLNSPGVSALATVDSSLFAGGFFTIAGGKSCSSAAQAILATPYIVTNDNNLGFTNSQFGFNVSGGTLQPVVVQGSTNLSDWISLQTNVMRSSVLYFSDPSASSFPQRFYRVWLAR